MYQGMTSVMPKEANKEVGFSPCHGETDPQRQTGKHALTLQNVFCHDKD